MFTTFEKNKAEFLAFQESIACHTVGILTDGGKGVGTGTLICFGNERLILTAHHVIEGNNPSSLRFAFRHEGTLQEALPRRFGTMPVPLLAGRPINISRVISDEQYDVAGLVLPQDYNVPSPAQCHCPVELREKGLPDGASLVFFGFPVDNAVDVGPATKSVGAICDHVKYDSTLTTTARYDPDRQFLMRYLWADEIEPHGLSGAGVWSSRKVSGTVWTPAPVLIGVITNYLRTSKVLIVANLSSVMTLLSEISKDA